MPLKNILIYGAGGVGGFLAGKMIQKTKEKILPYSISVCARGAHLKAIQQNGLTVMTQNSQWIVKPDFISDSIELLPKPDIIFICVKAYDLESVCQQIKTEIHPQTIIIPLLNGADIYERIKSCLPDSIILPSCIYISSFVKEPGIIQILSPNEAVVSGPDPKFPKTETDLIFQIFKDSEIQLLWQENPFPSIWKKYLMIASYALVTGAYQKTFGEILEDPQLIQQVKKIMLEIISIAKSKTIVIPEETIDQIIQTTKNLPYESKTSYQRDLETPGKSNEGMLFGETILSLGKEYGVQTPETEKIFNLIKEKYLR